MQTTVHESFPPAESLMRDVLRGGAPIAHEYPLVFDEAFDGRLVTAEVGEGEQRDGEASGLRSACAILARELIVPGARLPVGFIGSVVTHASYRGQGWGRRLLARAEDALREAGCACAMLWADDPGYYERLGWVAVGAERAYLVDPCVSSVLPSMQRVRTARADDFPHLFALYSAKPARVERTLAEMTALLSIDEMDVLVREDESGNPVAYSCVGRGADFASVVHEWAGSREDVLATLQAHIQHRLETGDRDPLVIMVPVDDDLAGFFDRLDAPSVTGVLGMARPLDPGRLLSAVRALLPDEVESTSDADGTVTLRTPRGELPLDPTELLLTILEPKGSRRMATRLEEAVDVSVPGLPLRPFVWGLDSI